MTRRHRHVSALTPLDRIRGALLGGAVGDALGAHAEASHPTAITAQATPAGRQDTVDAGHGTVTATTQLTLFTAEGILRAWVRMQTKGICGVAGVVHHALCRWLITQSLRPTRTDISIGTDGWLFGTPALHHQRNPDPNCLAALQASEHAFGPARANNTSQDDAGLARVAPIGLFAPTVGDDAEVFRMAADAAAITHGHPNAFLAAGNFAVILAALARGTPLRTALIKANKQLTTHDHHAEVAEAIITARRLAAEGPPGPVQVARLGDGAIASEALAIAIYSALSAADFAHGMSLAANHGAAAAAAGSLLGAQLGHTAIPPHWLARLELRDEIERLARDLHAVNTGQLTATDAWDAYPGW